MLHDTGYYTDGEHEHDREPLEGRAKAIWELQVAILGFAVSHVRDRYVDYLKDPPGKDLRDTLAMLFQELVSEAFRKGCCDKKGRVVKPLYEELDPLDNIERVDDVLAWMGYEGGLEEFLSEHGSKIERVLLEEGFLEDRDVELIRAAERRDVDETLH